MPNKYEMLKDAIYQLYSKEGRSKSYISRLLGLNRKTLITYINDVWELPKAEPHRYMKPSTQKFLNKNKQLIKARLDKDVTLVDIAKELGCTLSLLNIVISYDSVLKKAKDDYVNRIHISNIEKLKHDSSCLGDHNTPSFSYREYKTKVSGNSKKNNRVEVIDTTMKNKATYKQTSSKESLDFSHGVCQDIIDIDGEVWKPILGYDGYYVSNCGRVKHFARSYNSYHLLDIYYNPTTDRPYVQIANKNFLLYRLVAHAFVDGYTDERNTVNHIDGDTHNNKADNLEWVTQSESNKHSYSSLGRSKVRSGGKSKYGHFIYKRKYEFKTVTAFAKFIGKSETQARRWLDEPHKHEIEFLSNCND